MTPATRFALGAIGMVLIVSVAFVVVVEVQPFPTPPAAGKPTQ